jgi:class 3 adenylate cyclase/pimeloyl-ACP methyl ester carboxylesterase
MEPRVQYVKTADGVNIAYYEMGQGVTYVYMSMPFTHLTAEWQSNAALFTGIASTARLVRFDPRGFGLSDRNPGDLSLDAFTLDLEAVVDRLKLPMFILQGAVLSSWVGVNYAARHPDRVSRLVLLEAAPYPPPIVLQQAKAALSTGEDWRFVSETMLRFLQGWDRPERSSQEAAFLRECVDLDLVRRLFDSFERWDITEILRLVQTRAIVVNTRDNPWAGVQAGRELAAGLPKAELAIARGSNPGESRAEVVRAIQSFLGVPRPQHDLLVDQTSPAAPRDSGTAVILFTDIADSTALTERLGDAAFRAASRSLDEGIRSAMRDASGAAVDGKVLGDGVMGVFSSAAQAIEAARRCVAASAAAELPLHIGLHAGDVIHEKDNVYGGAVNIASRICNLCAPGEILVSQTVRDLARTSAGVTFEDRGEHTLKGIEDPVRVFAVQAVR